MHVQFAGLVQMKEEQRLIRIKSAHVSKFDIRLRPMVARRRNKTAENRLEAPVYAVKRSKRGRGYTG